MDVYMNICIYVYMYIFTFVYIYTSYVHVQTNMCVCKHSATGKRAQKIRYLTVGGHEVKHLGSVHGLQVGIVVADNSVGYVDLEPLHHSVT